MAKVIRRTWTSRGTMGRRVRKEAWGYTCQVDGTRVRKFGWDSREDADEAMRAYIRQQKEAATPPDQRP